jgi:S1-C subfamily serine protease
MSKKENNKMSALSELSKLTADLAEHSSAAVASVHVPRGLAASAVHWRDGLYVAAEETISADNDIGIILPSKERLSAELVGRDPSTGLALLRPAGAGPAATLLQAAPVGAGSLAVAVGRSEESVIAGFGAVSEVGAAWQSMRGGRIDRRIRLGMVLDARFEGGAAVGVDGGLIGIILFGPRRRPLVIPTETIERVATVLAEKGFVPRGYLGAGLHPLGHHGQKGAMVMSVDENGPAKAAGLLLGDIITGWGGEEIVGVREIMRRLGPDTIGKSVTLAVVRGGEERALDVVIGARPARQQG